MLLELQYCVTLFLKAAIFGCNETVRSQLWLLLSQSETSHECIKHLISCFLHGLPLASAYPLASACNDIYQSWPLRWHTVSSKSDNFHMTLLPGDEQALLTYLESEFWEETSLLEFYSGYCLNEETVTKSKAHFEHRTIKESFLTNLPENPFLPLGEDWFIKPIIHVK